MESVWIMSPNLYKALIEAKKIEQVGDDLMYEGKRVFVDFRVVGMRLVPVAEVRKKEGISEKWL